MMILNFQDGYITSETDWMILDTMYGIRYHRIVFVNQLPESILNQVKDEVIKYYTSKGYSFDESEKLYFDIRVNKIKDVIHMDPESDECMPTLCKLYDTSFRN